MEKSEEIKEFEEPIEELSEADLEQLRQLGGTTPVAEERQNVHTFLHNVATAEDTTKVGFLNDEEIGMPRLPSRTYKDLALFCEEVANMDYYAAYFNKKSEILTSTSLSKDAKLITLAVSQKREFADATKPRKVNKGWFNKKEKIEE